MSRFEDEYAEMKRLEEEGRRTVFSGSTAAPQPVYSHDSVPTGVPRDLIQHVGKVLTTIPDGFKLHPTLAKRFLPRRAEALKNGGPFDWAFAESLSWGTLLAEGNQVRLSGQDCPDDRWVVARGLPALGTRPQREAIGADGLALDFVRQAERGIVQQLDVVAPTLGPLDPAVAARPVEVAGDRDQGVKSAGSLDPSGKRIDAVARDKDRRPFGI
ncbi:MAG: hypothetical protein GY953_14175 [bacterium]|nr:hypothetical protein [bacterium]